MYYVVDLAHVIILEMQSVSFNQTDSNNSINIHNTSKITS